MNKGFGAIALIGGGTGALDKIDGNDLSDGDTCVVTTATGVYHYHLNATSGATENSPYVIAPDTNPGTKRWVLVTPAGPFSHVSANRSVTQSLASGTSTLIIYNTEVQDALDEYDYVTGIFTAINAGEYIVNAGAILSSSSWTVGERIFLIAFLDSVANKIGKRETIQASVTDTFSVSVSCKLTLTAGQTIDIRLNHDQGGAVNLDANALFNWLTIDRIA